jgi:hypothetical protein
MHEATRENRIPEHLPGAPKSEPASWSSFEDLDSNGQTQYAGCLTGVQQGVNRIGFQLGLDNNKSDGEQLHESSPPFSSYPPTTRATTPKAVVQPIQNETFQGHYMYVAYSRFGEEARDVLQLCEHQSLPTPGKGEVLVKVQVRLVSQRLLCLCNIATATATAIAMIPHLFLFV